MLLRCSLSHRDIVLPRQATFSIFVSMSASWTIYVFFMYSICHYHFHFITINRTTSLIQTNLLFGHLCQKFSLMVLLSFCLIFCKFQPSVAYKSVSYKKACNFLKCLKFEFRSVFSFSCILRKDREVLLVFHYITQL